MKTHYSSLKINDDLSSNYMNIYFSWSMIKIDVKINGKIYKEVVSFFFKDTLKLFNKLKKYVEEVKENSKGDKSL